LKAGFTLAKEIFSVSYDKGLIEKETPGFIITVM